MDVQEKTRVKDEASQLQAIKDEPQRQKVGIRSLPKQFQKLVIQTLLQKDKPSDDDSNEEFELPLFVGTILDLAKNRLREFPAELLIRAESVQYLYLDRNKLSKLPEEFFQNLRNLKWLDLRNNEIIALPSSGLESHKNLEFLLLQGNRIENLPTELGAVSSLKGLQIAGNPIVNVPHNIIAKGFHSLMKHLRKLNAQEKILLPNSDAIIVKPSNTKDANISCLNNRDCIEVSSVIEELNKSQMEKKSKPKDPVDASRGREWVGPIQNSYKPLNVWNETKKLLLRSKVCSRPKHRTVTLGYCYVTKRRSRLGYKKKMITHEIIHEKARRELQMAKKRETLEKQARKIQRMRDNEVLKSWRRHSRTTVEQSKLLDNYQQYPSRNFITDTPFDVSPEFLNMLNRSDLYWSLKEFEVIQKRKRNAIPKLQITVGEIERQMKEITNKLESINVSRVEGISPRSNKKHLCYKIAQMEEIQKVLKGLQIQNGSVTEISP